MSVNRRKFIESSALWGAGALSVGAASCASAAPADGAKQAPQQRRTAALGRREQQFYLVKITVSNLVRSYRFYTEVVGLRPASPQLTAPTDSDPEQDFREIPLNFEGTLADPIFVLIKRRNVAPSREAAGMTIIGFKVPDARAVLERAAQAGYTEGRRDPADGPMAFGFVSDPDGYTLELIQAPSFPAD